MMKEWKNNPESDEDTTTAEKMKQPAKEKLKSGQVRGKVPDVNDSPSAKAAKQVGRSTMAGSAAQCCSRAPLCSSIISLLVANKDLHHLAGEVFLPSKPCHLAAGPHI